MALVGAALRSVARTMIPRFFESGYSAAGAMRELRSLVGHAPRKQLFLADWRELTGAKKLERSYRFIPRKHALSYGLMAPTETFQSHEYRYIFDVTGKDTLTGEEVKRTMSLGSDTRYSIDKAEDEYTEIMDIEADRYKDVYAFEPVSVELRVVYRRKWKT